MKIRVEQVEQDCPLDFEATREELEGYAWLIRTLDAIIANDRPNRRRAEAAIRFISKLSIHDRDLHNTVHMLQLQLGGGPVSVMQASCEKIPSEVN